MPTLFSGAVESKRNLVGFIWSMVMAITITCTVATFVYSSRVRAGYAKNAMLGGYGYDDGGNRNDDAYYGYQDDGNGNNNNNNGGSGDRNEDFYYIYYLLASVKSIPLLICTMYSSVLVGLVTLYGSAYVVGFVGPTGRYVKPFLAKGGSNSALHLGIFVGMLFVFANLSLVCALIFSNIWVFDNMEGREKENMPPYAVESFARTFSYLFLIFSFIYSSFALVVISFRDSILEDGNSIESMIELADVEEDSRYN